MASLYQKRLAQRRKTSDITRLADQYKKNVEALTGEQDKAFAAYQAKAKQDMAPYEASIAQYNTAFTQYQQQAAAYQERLSQYQETLNQYQADPYDVVSLTAGKTGFDKAAASIRGLAQRGASKQDAINKGLEYYADKTGVYQLVAREIPKFSESAPTAPTPPSAPKIAEFDTSEFEAKRGQLETGFKRELGERKGARLAAVSRKTSRPLMQGQG